MKAVRLIATAVLLAGVLPATGATPLPAKLSADDFKSTFVTGKPFGSASNSGKKFSLTLNVDGTALIVPKGGKKGNSGTWTYADKGYCSKWGSGTEHCYMVQKTGAKYVVVDSGGQTIATWTPQATH